MLSLFRKEGEESPKIAIFIKRGDELKYDIFDSTEKARKFLDKESGEEYCACRFERGKPSECVCAKSKDELLKLLKI